MPVAAASPATPLVWLALGLGAATLLAWLIRRPDAQASWPRIGFGIALLAFCVALVLQLAVDLGSGASTLHLRLSRGINPAPVASLAYDGGVLPGRARRRRLGRVEAAAATWLKMR